MFCAPPHTLDEKIASLSTEVDAPLRLEIQNVFQTLRSAKNPVGVLLAMSRLSLQLMDQVLAGVGEKRPSDNLYDCILRAASGDVREKKIGLHLLPDEMASNLHTVRTFSNKADHAAERVVITTGDAENALNLFLRVTEWYYCEYSHGPHLPTLYQQDISGAQAPEMLVAPETEPLAEQKEICHNLSRAPTPYVGHEEEISRWLSTLLDPAVQLLTLTGFGGMGKTRSALEISWRCVNHHAGDFPDGIWWTTLDEVRSGSAMIEQIASALRLQLQPQPSGREQLLAFLRNQNLLLVLDNTEQIEEAGAVVKDLLERAHSVKYLVTSRCLLGLHAERVFEVPPLPPSESETLFETRARSRKADFAITPQNRIAVVRLCAALEGVPLAIELATSRITVLNPGEMLERLNERFRLLQIRSPELPARQRALRGAIDWSYELLGDEDRILFAQLSIFSGGFTMVAVERVCDTCDVLEGLSELRRHSFLQSSRAAIDGNSMRFQMFDSLRSYALEKLQESGDMEGKVRQLHLKYFLSLAEEYANQMRTGSEFRAMDDLGRERENLLAALQWAQESGRSQPCARLAVALYELLYREGFWAEAERSLEVGWNAAPEDRVLCAAVRRCQGSVAEFLGELDKARQLLQESMVLSSRAEDAPGYADALSLLGLVELELERPEQAQRYLEEALCLRGVGDEPGKARTLHNMGLAASRQGEISRAIEYYSLALNLSRRAGDVRSQGETLGNMANLAHRAGDYAEARRLYQESLLLRRDLQDRFGIAILLNNLGALVEDDDPGSAICLYVHAERLLCDLRSARASIPAESLQELKESIGAETFQDLYHQFESVTWEQAVEDVVSRQS